MFVIKFEEKEMEPTRRETMCQRTETEGIFRQNFQRRVKREKERDHI